MREISTRSGGWTSGDAYEPYVGRWSRRVASAFLAWLDVPPDRRWLEVGCGTGALTEAIVTEAAPAEVVGVEPAAAYLARARERVQDPRVRFLRGDADDAAAAGDGFDAVVSGLVLNFLPDPEASLARLRAAAAPGGVVAAYVWDYAEGMQMMRAFWDAAVALDPAAADLDEGRRFPLCRPEALHALFEGAGLVRVATEPLVVPTIFRDFDDYWAPFLGGEGPAPEYAVALPQDARERLRDRVRASLPVRDDGALALSARAWGVRGVRPDDSRARPQSA